VSLLIVGANDCMGALSSLEKKWSADTIRALDGVQIHDLSLSLSLSLSLPFSL
jgi:hypothetical protein